MAGPYLASYYFVTKDSEGWSENFVITEASIDDAATFAGGYINLRMALSPDNVDMVYAKVSDVTIKGDSKLVQPTSGNFPFIGTWTADPVGAYLEANTALLIKIVATPSKINRFFLRGLSLDVVTGREFKAPTAFVTALTALNTWLSTNVQVRTQDKPHVHPPSYTYAPATDAFFVRVTARKPGRPFAGPRGRKFAHRTAFPLAARSSTTSAVATQPKHALPRAPRP